MTNQHRPDTKCQVKQFGPGDLVWTARMDIALVIDVHPHASPPVVTLLVQYTNWWKEDRVLVDYEVRSQLKLIYSRRKQ